MRDEAVGTAIRAVRQRRGWRQRDVADRAGVAQSVLSDIERGQVSGCTIAVVRRVAAALDIELWLAPRWRGGDVGRLVDAAHAALVERVVDALRESGWEVVVEYTYNHFGERGSVDVAAWHGAHRALLIVEVKSRFVDLQELLARLAAKARIVPPLLASERRWRPVVVGCVVVAPGSHHVRAVVARHRSTFDAALPGRTWKVRRWLREPTEPLAALWLLPVIAGAARTRKRVRTCRSGAGIEASRTAARRDPRSARRAAER